MLLAHYWHAGGVRHFDELTGAVGQQAPVPRESADWGFLWRQRGKWFAIRKDHESLIFQHGTKQWRLRSGHEFSVTRGFLRQFKIRESGQATFTLKYLFTGAFLANIDPTYDSIDEESDDFFLYVSEMWAYWKDKDISTFLKT
ncbi:hypothetical protein [Collimonas sp.]|jgi:hypothetical protein|uniref:hypothetical protein n=1 Tax=Collimonas sp. TaxID=1963772 RepID=UPI002BC4393A|nr:hypothetical protein [Collimonas sp.]HWW99402.1 hypothetical protein [Collimonas sp.]